MTRWQVGVFRKLDTVTLIYSFVKDTIFESRQIKSRNLQRQLWRDSELNVLVTRSILRLLKDNTDYYRKIEACSL